MWTASDDQQQHQQHHQQQQQTSRERKCRECKRPLKVCNASPCESKLQLRNSNSWSPSPSPPSSRTSKKNNQNHVNTRSPDYVPPNGLVVYPPYDIPYQYSSISYYPLPNSPTFPYTTTATSPVASSPTEVQPWDMQALTDSFGNQIQLDASQASNSEGRINGAATMTMTAAGAKAQQQLIKDLHQKHYLQGNTVMPAVVRGCTQYGLLVDLTVFSTDRKEQWLLEGMVLQWSDLPKSLVHMPLESRIEYVLHYLPPGTTFHAYCYRVVNDFDVRFRFARHTNVVFHHLQEVAVAASYTRKCPFDYLLVVDLEATCDYDPQPKVTVYDAEIIEFPWVVIDTRTCEIIDSKQIFVQPSSEDRLTHYCSILTGIKWDQLRSAPDLAGAINEFEQYLADRVPNYSFRIVTDGVWDLQVQLRTEASQKNVKLDVWFNEYFDLKEEFCKFIPLLPEYPRPPLKEMLKAFKLELHGKHHSGIDDCHSIAKIVQFMLRCGHAFENPRVIPSDYNPRTDSEFVDFGSSTTSESWKCISGPECGVWNRPWYPKCPFCGCVRPTSNAPA